MKIKQLRLVSGCHVLKADNNFMDGPTCKIDRIDHGDYMVTLGTADPVIIPSGRVEFSKPLISDPVSSPHAFMPDELPRRGRPPKVKEITQ